MTDVLVRGRDEDADMPREEDKAKIKKIDTCKLKREHHTQKKPILPTLSSQTTKPLEL